MDSAREASRWRAGFTLVEIMIVVTIIGLVAAIALPSFARSRKVSQAQRIINDVRMLDNAVSLWAQEKNKKDGDPIIVAEVATYLKTGTWPMYDLLGNPWAYGTVGNQQIQIWWRTKSSLAGVGIDWGPY